MSKLKVKLWHIKLPDDKTHHNIEGQAHERGYTIFEHTEDVVGEWGYTSRVTEYYFLNESDALMVANDLSISKHCVKWKHVTIKAKFEFS